MPSGKATIDQPSLPGALTCEVLNVILPDGTVLFITGGIGNVGTLNLSDGRAKMQTTIPYQVLIGSFLIEVDGVIIMTGRWK